MAAIAISWPMNLHAQTPFTYETPTEMSASGDINGDGLQDIALLDVPSSSIRLLLQQAGGGFSIGRTTLTGLDQVSAFAMGKLYPTSPGRELVVTSAAENKMLRIAPMTGTITSLSVGGISPGALSLREASATDDSKLLIQTIANDLPALKISERTFSASGLISTFIPDAPQTVLLGHGNSIHAPTLSTDGRPFSAFVEFDASGSSGFQVSGGRQLNDLPHDALWTYGPYDSANGGPHVLLYQRNSNTFLSARYTLLGFNQRGFLPGVAFTFPKPIHLLMSINHPTGCWLLALFDGGNLATLYQFDGSHAPVARQSWLPPGGEPFTMGGMLANGDFLLLSGKEGRSTDWSRYSFDGTKHKNNRAGLLDSPAKLRGRDNVFVFDADPFISDQSFLFELKREGDWSVTRTQSGSNWTIGSLVDAGTEIGLRPPANNKTTNFSQNKPMVNQFLQLGATQPVSVSSISNRVGAIGPQINFDPPAGNYALPTTGIKNGQVSSTSGTKGFAVRLSFPTTGAFTAFDKIYYRISLGGAWQTYSGSPIYLTESTTIYAKGDQLTGLDGQPTSATYNFGSASPSFPTLALPSPTNANGNNLSDNWENAFNLGSSIGDDDNDGTSNRDEYLAGTDPQNPNEHPGPSGSFGPLVLNDEQLTDQFGNHYLSLFWDVEPAASLQYSLDLLHWKWMNPAAIQLTADERSVDVPLDQLPAEFFRLKR